ncbi:hypothetical protein [uncultured Clostridium sp.]|uniref:hypothetical protein n=1 Tax=uncultured Clostridium sp. TaxID=59620 RepID=UPI00349F7901
MAKSYEMDMCNGPILGKVLTYSIPLMLSGVLQLLFNAADVIVVGRFAGSQSLAAVPLLIFSLTSLSVCRSVRTFWWHAIMARRMTAT